MRKLSILLIVLFGISLNCNLFSPTGASDNSFIESTILEVPQSNVDFIVPNVSINLSNMPLIQMHRMENRENVNEFAVKWDNWQIQDGNLVIPKGWSGTFILVIR